ncbi:MAG: HigA family addiction module antitoxin [Marinicellaceae bacterium]
MMFNPTHAGEILKETYLVSLDLTIGKASEMLGVSRKHLSRFINGHVSVTAEFALRLQAFTGKSAIAWLNIQNNYDLWLLKDKSFDVEAA